MCIRPPMAHECCLLPRLPKESSRPSPCGRLRGTFEALPMKRRQFVKVIAGLAAAWPLAVRAGASDRMRRIGLLANLATDDPETSARRAAFLQGLHELGWSEDRNVRIDY